MTDPTYNVPLLASQIGCRPTDFASLLIFIDAWMSAVHCTRYEYFVKDGWGGVSGSAYAEPETSVVSMLPALASR